ncbi:MAG: LysM domain-containing protein [Planctomycetota bacterium]|nr:LysM domain-containing protein [Planctomycetota bacterium]MDA1105843.1 LysM domain-containing protein [Planctomycetota bacterium]
MTREIKVALVLGFGLLLFSGILVSDHLAARRKGDAARMAAADAETILRPTRELQSLQGTPAVSTVVLRPDIVPVAVTNGAQVAMGGPTSIAPAAPERKHSIQSGETIASICRSTYGDTKLLDELLDYNKSSVPDPARMRVGVTIRLPDAAVLRGEQVAIALPGMVLPGEPIRTPVAGSSLRTYTVKPGDIPGRIAQTQLGSAKHVDALLQANPGLDPRKMKPGMVINIPNIS